MSWTLGIETGGTFTDLFLVGPGGQVYADKIPSMPTAPTNAAGAVLCRVMHLASIEATAVSRLLHGSTVAVNALLEWHMALPALFATRSFRDMLFISQQEKTHIYDMFYAKPEPFIERASVYEVGGCIGPTGRSSSQWIWMMPARSSRRWSRRPVRHPSWCACCMPTPTRRMSRPAIAGLIRDQHPNLWVVLSSNMSGAPGV